eukprot:gene1847-biopygen8878
MLNVWLAVEVRLGVPELKVLVKVAVAVPLVSVAVGVAVAEALLPVMLGVGVPVGVGENDSGREAVLVPVDGVGVLL